MVISAREFRASVKKIFSKTEHVVLTSYAQPEYLVLKFTPRIGDMEKLLKKAYRDAEGLL